MNWFSGTIFPKRALWAGLIGLLWLTAGNPEPAAAINPATGYIMHTPVTQWPERQPLNIEIGFTARILRASVFYRYPGDPAFIEVEMTERVNGKFGALIDRVRLERGQTVEYYIAAETDAGDVITYPEFNAEMNPIIVTGAKPVMMQSEVEAVILSPEPDQTVSRTDFMLAVSLFSETEVNVKNIIVRLDGNDVTRKSDVTAELVTYTTKDLNEGPHTARVEYILASNEIYKLAEWSFTIVQTGGEEIFSGKGFSGVTAGGAQMAYKPQFDDSRFRANFRTEYKAQKNLGEEIDYGRVGADLSYEKKWFKVAGTFDFDSQDDPRKNQALSRYLISGNLDNILLLDYGDTYPVFSPVTLYGTRVRGVSTGVFLGIFNFQLVRGEVNRKVLSKSDERIQSKVDSLYRAYINSNPDSVILSALNDPGNALYKKSFTGTFRRDLFGMRASVGPREFQFGLSYVKAKDAQGSLSYNQAKSIAFSGIKPKENVVFGADFNMDLFDRRVHFDASGAAGITNEDITGGNLDASVFSDYGFGDMNEDKINMLKDFITVNTNLNPIPINGWKDNNLFAYTFGGAVNMFNNNFNTRYRHHGGYFQSFGSSIVRDIQSFEISDRYRFWDNRAYVSVSYMTTKNNLAKRNVNTLKTDNLGFQFAVFLPHDLPTLTFGFTTLNRDNGFTTDTTASKFFRQVDGNARPEKNTTNIYSVSSSYSFFLFDLRHNASLSFNTSSKKDKTDDLLYVDSIRNYRYNALGNSSSNTFALGLTTEWKIPLRTSVAFSMTSGKVYSLSQDTASAVSLIKSSPSAASYNASAEYMPIREKDFKLSIYGGAGLTSYKLTGVDPVTLTNFNLGQRFNFYTRHTVFLDLSLTAGLEIPKRDASGTVTGKKDVVNRVFTARYEFVF